MVEPSLDPFIMIYNGQFPWRLAFGTCSHTEISHLPNHHDSASPDPSLGPAFPQRPQVREVCSDSDIRRKHEDSAEIIQTMGPTERSANPSDTSFVTRQSGGKSTALFHEQMKSRDSGVVLFLPFNQPERVALKPVADPHGWYLEVNVLAWLEITMACHPYLDVACTSHFDKIIFSGPIRFRNRCTGQPLPAEGAEVEVAVAGKPAHHHQNPGANSAQDVKSNLGLLQIQVFP